MIIEFRARHKEKEQWVFGYPVIHPDGSASIVSKRTLYEVHPVIADSIQQFTGVIDSTGRKVFHQDKIVAYHRQDVERKHLKEDRVIFVNGCFMVFGMTFFDVHQQFQPDWQIGNVREEIVK